MHIDPPNTAAGSEPAPSAPPAKDPALEHALKLILWDSLASEAMGTLTTGVFLVGQAVALNAGNFMIGVLAAIPFAGLQKLGRLPFGALRPRRTYTEAAPQI